MNYRTVLTTCPYCGCGCGMYLPVLNGQLGQPIPDRWFSFPFTLQRARPTCSLTGYWILWPRYRSLRCAPFQ